MQRLRDLAESAVAIPEEWHDGVLDGGERSLNAAATIKGLSASVGWHGTMKPGGRRRFGLAQRVGVRINIKAL